MSSNYITDILKEKIKNNGQEVIRRNRKMKEINSFSFTYTYNDIISLNFRDSEYKQYSDMIQDKLLKFFYYLQTDKFSRRLLIQFPSDWYENSELNYMPCPESFLILYVNENEYDVIFNERSTEYNRATEDVAIIYNIIKNDLKLKGKIRCMKVHYMNLHMYLDGGSSEDFEVKKGYFSVL